MEHASPFPPLEIEKHGGLYVARDDRIDGGTKRRILHRLLSLDPSSAFVYAGTIFGHGALALALACRDHGKTARFFLCANDNAHPMLDRIRRAGGVIDTAAPQPMAELTDQARNAAREHGAKFLPPGFDMPEFYGAARAVLAPWNLARFPQIWCASVSGTFARCLDVVAPSSAIVRVSAASDASASYQAPEKYHRPALSPPPYPSCPHTDAKVWQFASRHAMPGSLVWNVAG